jgi:hypothetical protein
MNIVFMYKIYIYIYIYISFIIATTGPLKAWYEMYVKLWHPDLAMMGMRVLSQIIFLLPRASVTGPLED